MSMEDVVLQVKENCPCFIDSEEKIETLVERVVKLLSTSACWSRNTCETLLSSVRTERMEMPCMTCDCCGQIERFVPYYQYGIDFSSLVVTMITQTGLATERTEIPKTSTALTNINGYYEILVDLAEYVKDCECKSCDLVMLEFEYIAGYEKLPDCLFPEVCELIKTIVASTMGCGSIDECCEMTQPEVGYKLKSKKLGELSWSWAQDKNSIEYIYQQLYISNRFKTLGMISLCGTNVEYYSSSLWAITNKQNPKGCVKR